MPCGTGQRGSGVGMDLKRLEYFCAIVEKGQISKAAEALHISQPPLSMRLKELEEELDVQLIYREGKAWQVTPEGEALYQRAQFILSYVAGLERIFGKAGTRSPVWCGSGCARRASRWQVHPFRP